MHDFFFFFLNDAHRVSKSDKSSTCADILGMLYWVQQPPHWFDNTQWKYRTCNVDDHDLLDETLFMCGTLKAPKYSETSKTQTAYRLQKIPVDCPCEWADKSRRNMYSQQALKITTKYILLTFFLPFLCMEICKREIWSWAKAWFHWISHSSRTGKNTISKKKKGSWLSNEVLIFSVTYTEGNSHTCTHVFEGGSYLQPADFMLTTSECSINVP